MLFRGQVYYQPISKYAALIWPLAQLKRAMEALYRFILGIIWSELTTGKKVEGYLFDLVFFSFFCCLSLFFFYTRNYQHILIFSTFLVWLIDYQIAKYKYSQKLPYLITSLQLDKSQERFLWQMPLPDGKIIQTEFNTIQVKEITICSKEIYGGAFQELMGTVWQVEIVLYDGAQFLIYETKDAAIALKKAQKITKFIEVLICWLDSEGSSDYAMQSLDKQDFDSIRYSQAIRLQKNQNKWQIHYLWTGKNFGLILKQVMQKSGFFLFVLIMRKMMIHFGAIVHFVLAYYFGIKVNLVYQPNLLQGLIWHNHWWNLGELAIAIIIILVKGWQLSQSKSIYLDANSFNFYLGNSKQSRLNTQDITDTLLIKRPYPAILVFTEKNLIEICNLQQEGEYRNLLLTLDEGISYFQTKIKDST